MNRADRFNWIDSLRGFLVLLVLIGHIPNIPFWLFKWIYGFHLPLFFVISGYLFNYSKWKSLGFKKYIYNKTLLYLLPFVLFSILIATIEIFKFYSLNRDITLSYFSNYISEYFKWILLQIDGDFCGGWIAGLWFLPTIFISNILLFLIYDKTYKKIIVAVIALASILLISKYSYTKIPFHLDVSLIGTIFMLFGSYLRNTNVLEKINNKLLILLFFILSNISFFINSLLDLKKHIYPSVFMTLFGVFLLSYCLVYIFKNKQINTKFLNLYGRYSIIVIALNFVINYVISTIFSSSINWYFFIIIEVIIFELILSIFNYLYNKFPKLGIIIGNRK